MQEDEEVKVVSRVGAFLAAVRETGSVKAAAEAAGISREQHYRRVKSDPAYKAAFEVAMDDATQMLEDEAVRRATKGVIQKVYYQGDECGERIVYSDAILMCLLRAKRPERYRDSSTVSHTGPDGGPVQSSIEIKFVSPGE